MADHLQAATSYEGHKGAVYALCAVDEDTFLSAGGDGIVVRWRTDAPEQGEALINAGEPVFSLAYDHVHDLVLVGTGSGRLLSVSAKSRSVVEDGTHVKGIFRILQYGEHGLFTAGGDGMLGSWTWSDAGAGSYRKLRSIPLSAEKLRDLELFGGAEEMAVAAGDGTIRILRARDLNEVARADGHEGGATAVIRHRMKQALLSGGKDGHIKVWRLDGSLVHSVAAHKGTIYSVITDPAASYILTAGRDALLKVWNAETLEPTHRSKRDRSGHTHSINAMITCGGLILTGSDDRRIRGWRSPRP
ncbi:MAG TPA: hypothetical protein PKJ19_05250 [Flavobacteriales bacterium]|nr:hypothetical protein [Flavobacteriales bacterium]HNU55141.1 hypothetical protein [Flavobacteriales bacterium]